MKDRADEMTDKQLESFFNDLKAHPGKYTKDSEERWAWYTDPANKDEVDEQLSHMQLVMELHKARKEAGLTQEQLAELQEARKIAHDPKIKGYTDVEEALRALKS